MRGVRCCGGWAGCTGVVGGVGVVGLRCFGCRHSWMSTIIASELALVLRREGLVGDLRRSRLNMVLMHRGSFLRVGLSIHTTVSVVRDGGVVHDSHVVHVHVGGVEAGSEAGVGGVVEEVPAAPLAADEAGAEVAEAVVNAAIEANMGAPITAMEDVEAVFPAPIRGRPEIAGRGCEDPGAGDPVIAAVISIGPVAWRPDVAIAGDDGLNVDGKRRRSNADLDDDRRSFGGRGCKERQRKGNGCGDREAADCVFDVHKIVLLGAEA